MKSAPAKGGSDLGLFQKARNGIALATPWQARQNDSLLSFRPLVRGCHPSNRENLTNPLLNWEDVTNPLLNRQKSTKKEGRQYFVLSALFQKSSFEDYGTYYGVFLNVI